MQECIDGLMFLMTFALVVHNLAEMELSDKLPKVGGAMCQNFKRKSGKTVGCFGGADKKLDFFQAV